MACEKNPMELVYNNGHLFTLEILILMRIWIVSAKQYMCILNVTHEN